MTRPNPTHDELQRANQRANKSEADALEAAGITRSDKMAAIKRIDALDGVSLAFGDGATVHVCVPDGDDGSEAERSLREGGFDFEATGDDRAPFAVSLGNDEAGQ